MTRRSSLGLFNAVLVFVVGCGGAATPAPVTPGASPGTDATGAEAAAPSPGKSAEANVIPPPPAECTAYLERAAPAAAGACDDKPKALVLLDLALGENDAATRDAKLVALEACRGLPPGLVRALRADFAPAVCADALAKPLLSSAAVGQSGQGPAAANTTVGQSGQGPAAANTTVGQSGQRPAAANTTVGLRLDVKSTLQGLALGGQLARLVHSPPKFEPPLTKPRFQEFFKTKLAPWIKNEAAAIQALSAEAARLGGYGKGIAAIEAGLADMRFVEVSRDVALPEELANDEELKNAYYASLDEALELRKNRGRDAALVGLRELAAEGVLRDPRVERARALLSKLYAGRRIDALDGLLLPPLGAADYASVERRLAARLPTFYSGIVLSELKPTDPALLRALLERGIPPAMRAGLDTATLSPELRELYARAMVELGQRYWRSQDFERAQRLLERSGGAKAPSESARLVAGLAAALRGGPQDAAHMMLRGPFLPKGVGDVSELDALAKNAGPIAGMALYDAAYILALVPPREPDPAFWKQVGARFRRSSKLLTDPSHKRSADERAKAAEDTAKALH